MQRSHRFLTIGDGIDLGDSQSAQHPHCNLAVDRVVFGQQDPDSAATGFVQRMPRDDRRIIPALPGQRLSAKVERLSPVASQREGRNGFEVEASLASAASGVLPGMEGHARIVLGERRLIALWGGRALDWLDFQRWRLLGN